MGSALIDMYSKCGSVDSAQKVFDEMFSGYAKLANLETSRSMFVSMADRNIISWNALIAGYTQNGDNETALGLFLQLKQEGVFPTHYTFGNLLSACANLADLRLE